MESESKPSFTWPLAPSKPRARTPITAKPPLAPLPRVPRASVPPPMRAEPVRPVEVAAAWIEPVRVEPPPIVVEPDTEPEPVRAALLVEPLYLEPESGAMTLDDDVSTDHGGLDSMSTFGAGVLNQRRGANKFFLFAALLAVIAVDALVFLR